MMMAMVLRKGNILTQTPDSTEWIQTKRQICASSEMCASKFCAAVQCYWIVRCCSLMGGEVCAQRCWRMCSNAKAICPISVNMPCPSHSCHSEGERSGNGCNLLTICLCCKHFQCDILSYVVRSCHILSLCVCANNSAKSWTRLSFSCLMSFCLCGECYLPWKYRWQFRFIKPNWKKTKNDK